MYGPLSFVAIMATALNDRYESGVRIRRNRKLPFDVNSRAMAGDGSTPAAYVAQGNGANGRTAVVRSSIGDRLFMADSCL